jgi:hypothetical protein
MGRKKGHIVNLKPFCYYCDKEFNNELILHQHQKARHFNCVKCRKRFSTAPALDTHEIQVHRSSLKRVPNAKAGRDSFEISIYGMDGVPIELINYKLAEKIEQKKRKLIKEHKMAGLNEEKNEIKNLNYLDMKEKKDKDIRDLLQKTSEQGGEGFYHNPDSINLTLKQNQMKSMFININRAQNNTNNNLYGYNIEENNYDINKKEKDKDRDRDKKNKDKEDKKEEKETGILSLEQFNKELD